ncbi:MAG: putative coiled-coil protein SlyX [Bacteriovoracaceae bacterium]|jgi:uncharacterized coiled-coil protein SlyX|nr:hypothetical protein [Pseudomonadota bacterium]
MKKAIEIITELSVKVKKQEKEIDKLLKMIDFLKNKVKEKS